MTPSFTIPTVALLSLVTSSHCAPCGGMSCAADMPDADEFISGTVIPAMVIPVEGVNITVDPGVGAVRKTVVLAMNEDDPFMRYMRVDGESLERFFSVVPIPDVDFVFVSHTNTASVVALKEAMGTALANLHLSPASTAKWKSLLYYATEKTIEQMSEVDVGKKDFTVPSENVLGRVLKSPSFHSITKSFGVTLRGGKTVLMPRLDGFFQFVNTQDVHNHSPVNPINAAVHLVPSNIICDPTKTDPNLDGKIAVISAASLPKNCSYEDAILWVKPTQNVPAVVVMAAQNEPLREIGQHITGNDESGFYTVGTMVSHNAEVLEGLSEADATGVLQYKFTDGQYIAVGSDGKLRQIGSPINPLLAVLSWQGQYLVYEENLRSDLGKPSYDIPLISNVIGNVKTTGSSSGYEVEVTVPEFATKFNKASLEVGFGCQGNGDFECPVWDRIATVVLTCTGGNITEYEVVRWISPYRRAVGHWVTDVTPLLPLFTQNIEQKCVVKLSGFSSWLHEPWVTSVTLRLQSDESQPTPASVTKLFAGGTFDTHYNSRQPISVNSVSGGVASIFAYITGHGSDSYGCCEFKSTRHIFTVNGVNFTATFQEPEDMWGCTKHVTEGVEPNGFGAWWFGRNGWCNGHKVVPYNPDVSSAFNFKGTNSITYSAEMYDDAAKVWVQPPCTSGCGDIDMSSYLSVSQ